jgi:hypothetical protein
MRWSASLGLLLATARLAAVFCLVAACDLTLVGELDETKGEAPGPMSRNQAPPLALAICVSVIAAIDVMSIVFIGICFGFIARSDAFLSARLVCRRNSAIRRLQR